MKIASTKEWLARTTAVALVAALACVGLIGCASPSSETAQQPAEQQTQEPAEQKASETRTVTDMAGRTVEIPGTVESVATFGSVGVLNAFVECGQGRPDRRRPQRLLRRDGEVGRQLHGEALRRRAPHGDLR